MPKVKGAHHRGTYHVDSRKVREAANRNPNTRCWRCGLTLDQARTKWGPHVHWQAGHVRTGDPTRYASRAYTWVDDDDPATLDACHGHVGPDGGYHYHATSGYPYTVGCYRGTPVVSPLPPPP